MNKPPEDTSKRTPDQHWAGMNVVGSSQYIENMEAAGTKQLAEQQGEWGWLPIPEPEDKPRFEEVGFVFLDELEIHDRPLFQWGKLPKGWYRAEPLGRHFDIMDERGFNRGTIFYKAAFYDRYATLVLLDVSFQKTAAQADTGEKLHEEFRPDGENTWKALYSKSRREGDLYVYVYGRPELDEMGRPTFSNEKYDRDGDPYTFLEVVEVRVNMDGTELERRMI